MSTKIRLFVSLCLLFTAVGSFAVKYQPGTGKVRQSDGTYLTVKGYGNHDFSYFMTLDGVLLFQEGTDFHIAGIAPNGTLYSTGVIAHEKSMRSGKETELAGRQDKMAFRKNMAENVRKAKIKREPMEQNPTLLPHVGSPKVPVLLVEFSDTLFTVENTKAVFDKYLNATELFDSETDKDMGRNYGSVKRYFSDMSFGLFTPQFDVYGPVKLDQPLKHYGGGASSGENMTDLLNHACKAVDDEVDFSQYDSNGDGKIDLVYIIYAGYSESLYGNSTECIYPKSGVINGGIELDGKKVYRYGVNNELNGTPADQASMGLLINGIGLFCHEFSHCMGLPDIYPSPGSVAQRCIDHGLDYWDLMDAGEYTYNGYRPTEYTCWERERFGWIKIDTLSQPASLELKSLSDGGKAYRIINDKDATGHEYYLIENVQRTGWNRYIPNSGMLVYHVDYDDYKFSLGGCKVNSEAGHPRMTLIAADGMFVPEYHLYTTISESDNDTERQINAPLYEKYSGQYMTYEMYSEELDGDTYPGQSGATSLTDYSTPANAWVYTGETIGKPITDIVADKEKKTVSFKFMGGVDLHISDITDNSRSDSIYTLDGRYAGTDIGRLKKGIYILNNKKVAIR